MSDSAVREICRRLALFLVLALIAGGVLLSYRWQLAGTYDYKGYRPIMIDGKYLVTLTGSLVLLSALMPLHVRRPSDFFAFFYLLLVFFPYALLHSIRGPVSELMFLAVASLILMPHFLILIFVRMAPKIRSPAILPAPLVTFMVAMVCVFGACVVVAMAPSSAGFELTYDRRLEGREIFGPGSVFSYLNSIVANGFAPFLGFLAGYIAKGRLRYAAVAIGCEVAYFYALGLKSPILFTVMAYALGVMARKGRFGRMPTLILAGICASLLIFLAEYFTRGTSFVVELLIRRALTEPPFLVSAYAEFMLQDAAAQWNAWSGVDIPGDITFFVGENYLGVPGSNANTNTFLDRLAAGGLPAYFGSISLVAAVFGILDALHRTEQNPALIYVGFAFSFLLVEQSATVALVSSGIGSLLMVAGLMRSGIIATRSGRPAPS